MRVHIVLSNGVMTSQPTTQFIRARLLVYLTDIACAEWSVKSYPLLYAGVYVIVQSIPA